MKKITTILYCLAFCVAVYGLPYAPYNSSAAGYYQIYPTAQCQSYQYQFKSTSPYTPIVQYQTVKPLNQNGLVSNEYTTNYQPYRPIYSRRGGGLDLDDDDETIAGKVPIGEPIIPCLILILLYIGYKQKTKKCAY